MKASFPSPQCSRPPSSRYPCDPECLHDQLQVCPRFGRVGKLQQVLNRRVAHFVLTQGSLRAFHRHGVFEVAVSVADEFLRAFQPVARTPEIGVGPFRDLHVFRQGIVERQQLCLMDPILGIAAIVRLDIEDQCILFIVERQQLCLMDPILGIAAIVRLDIEDQRILFIVDFHRITVKFSSNSYRMKPGPGAPGSEATARGYLRVPRRSLTGYMAILAGRRTGPR